MLRAVPLLVVLGFCTAAHAQSVDVALGGAFHDGYVGPQLSIRLASRMTPVVSAGARVRGIAVYQPGWHWQGAADLTGSLRLITENGDAQNLVFAGVLAGPAFSTVCHGDVCGNGGLYGGGEVGTTLELSQSVSLVISFELGALVGRGIGFTGALGVGVSM